MRLNRNDEWGRILWRRGLFPLTRPLFSRSKWGKPWNI